METVTVPTAILEAMKVSLGSNYYNNELDATISNPHIKRIIENLESRKVQMTNYTDGTNELIVVGEGVNQKHFTGTSILSA